MQLCLHVKKAAGDAEHMVQEQRQLLAPTHQISAAVAELTAAAAAAATGGGRERGREREGGGGGGGGGGTHTETRPIISYMKNPAEKAFKSSARGVLAQTMSLQAGLGL